MTTTCINVNKGDIIPISTIKVYYTSTKVNTVYVANKINNTWYMLFSIVTCTVILNACSCVDIAQTSYIGHIPGCINNFIFNLMSYIF